MNVAVHLNNFGMESIVISRVGNDELGDELLHFLKSKNMATDWIQKDDTHITGIVNANISDRNEVVYDIVQPVAWDYIQYSEELEKTVSEVDVFIYGTLAARQSPSRSTLYQLLEAADYKVFDSNLRPPHYGMEETEKLLHYADMLKINQQELIEISAWFGKKEDDLARMQLLQDKFKISEICVSLGEKGAVLLKDGQLYQQQGFRVNVADTIGSGDSFLAAYLYKSLAGETPQDTLSYACAVGALIASKSGATPEYTEAEILNLMNS